jgi:hypothetical protein
MSDPDEKDPADSPLEGATRQLAIAPVVQRDMKPENMLEAERRQRLTRQELQAEDGERDRRACTCWPSEWCFCDAVREDQEEAA